MIELMIGKNKITSSGSGEGSGSSTVETKSITLTSSDFTLEDELYCATVSHNLNNLNPIVSVFNSDGNVEYSITDRTNNDFKIWLLEADTITLGFLIAE